MDFPTMIKSTRLALGETQQEFADRFDTHANTVSRWESGQYQAPYEALSFVVGFAHDLAWQTCRLCNGTGRVKTKFAKDIVKEKI